ncbi:hypothetical protein [Agaribacter marinus]|uniref:Uncharacterized protein n=1 Tax=Agaribacter marinus TaxID=1431249 RepID=A0AA37T2I8_9ALTE|nr:hypothetical protein [Agaribacter marinus]GLR71093.1 hypothetical protein GCM10007852_20010 [Agaribacter marinus]
MFTYNLKRSFLILTNFAAFNLAVPKEVIAEHAITFVHVCGLNAQTPSCKQIDENFLISKVQAYLEYKNNSRCQRPNNPSCGALIKSATSYHVIYDTTSEQVKKKKLHVELTDRGHVTEYNVSSVSPTYQEKNALQPMLVYKNELATVGKRFSFSVNDSGKMMNLLGETLSDVASLYGRSSSTHTDGQSIGNCRTMLDYVNNTRINSSLPSCQNQLNTFLDNAMDAAQNDLQHLDLKMTPNWF